MDHRPDRDLRRDFKELDAVAAIADEVAATAHLVQAKDGGTPVALVQGLGRYVTTEDGPGARELLRPRSDNLFL